MNPFADCVILTGADVRLACDIAWQRQTENAAKGRRDARGLDNATNFAAFVLHLQGAFGEVGFASLHCLCAKKVTLGSWCDVGPIEVKAVLDPTHCMIVRPETPPETVCALMLVSRLPRVPMIGWAVAGEVMRKEWLRDPNKRGAPAFFVPEAYLRRGLVPRARLFAGSPVASQPEEVW